MTTAREIMTGGVECIRENEAHPRCGTQGDDNRGMLSDRGSGSAAG